MLPAASLVRGPNAQGYLVAPPARIVHRRRSIIGGQVRQPVLERQRIALTKDSLQACADRRDHIVASRRSDLHRDTLESPHANLGSSVEDDPPELLRELQRRQVVAPEVRADRIKMIV